MTGIDRRDDFLRRGLEEAQRAEQQRRAEEAVARAAQLAAELARAIAEANAREAARVMTEANRLPQEAQRAFFGTAGEGGSATPVETVRQKIAECFPGESEGRLELGGELARQQGADPRSMSRTALESVASRSLEKLGGMLARVQARGSAVQDVVERRPNLGLFRGEAVQRSVTAAVARGAGAAAAPGAGEGAAILLPSDQPGMVAEARAWSEISARGGDVVERPAVVSLGGSLSSPGAEFDKAALREALGQAKGVLGKKALGAQVKSLKWTESARHVAAPGMARVRERLAEVKEGVSRAREALAQGGAENLRVLYGKSEANSAFESVIERVRAAQDSLTAQATTVERRGFFTAVEQARAELGAAQEHVGEAGIALREVVGEERGDVRAAMAEVQDVEQAARAAEGELALVEGRTRVLEDAEVTGGLLSEGEGAPLEAPAEGAPGDEPGVFTEADLQKIGSGLDPAKRPPQTLWNENMVNEVSSLGRKQGGITEEQGGKNAELARSLLVPEGKGEEGPAELSAVDVAAALKASGMALERVDPNQLGAAARYINTGTSRAEQAEKLRKTLDNFQVLDRIGLPKMKREQLMGQLDSYAKIPGAATGKLKEKDLQAKFQEVAATLNGGGEFKQKIGKYKVELKVDPNGKVLTAKAKKQGLFSRIVSGITKVAKIVTPIALTVMSFIPVTAPFALAANAAISVYKAIKAKSFLGIVAAGASLVGAGVGIIAGKAASIAGTLANKISTVANATARTLQGVQAARQGNVLGAIAGIAGAAASGVSQVAGAFGEKMGKFADTMNKYASRVTSGVMAVDAARRGDYLGAVGLGASLAADFNFTGPGADKYLRHVSNGALQARTAQTAIRQGDYFAAGAAFSSLAAGIAHGNPGDPNAKPAHPSLVKDLQRVSTTLSYLSTAQSSVQSRNYFGAASALTQAAGLHMSEGTQKQMQEVSSYLQRAGGAYTQAARGDYLGAAGELTRLASSLPWDAKTKGHLLDAADAFKAGSGIPAAIRSGDFVTAASLMSLTASVYADGKTKASLSDAATYLAEGAPAYNLLRRGDYLGAATVLGQMAATHGLLPGTKNLETATTVIQTVDGVARALQAGDYALAAGLIGSAAGPHLGPDAARGLEQAGGAIEAMTRVQRALRDRDWVAAAEAANELARVLNQGRLMRTPPIALTSAAGGLQRAVAAGNEQQILAEATRLGSALSAIAPELGRPLQALAQSETQAALGAQAESLMRPAGAAAVPSVTTPGAATYTVQRGDTLSAIARRFGTTVQDIVRANPSITDPNLILVGQGIRLPATGQGTPSPLAQSTLAPPPPATAAAAGAAQGSASTQAGAGPQPTYLVQPGDTLSAIARRFGTTVQDMARLNSITDPDRIFAGQLLRIPVVGAAAPPAQGASTADRIRELTNYSLGDWRVGPEDERKIVDLLKADPNLHGTVSDLDGDGTLARVLDRVDEVGTRRELVQLLGRRLSGPERALAEKAIVPLGPQWELQFNLGALGVTQAAPPVDVSAYTHVIGRDPSAPFSGVGATGQSPTQLSIPLVDQALLASGDPATRARYSNPLGDLAAYLGTLSPSQRDAQVSLLLMRSIGSVEPQSYAQLPSRAEIIEAAARRYNLQPDLVAAFILAEQRDQSSREDAADYLGATSVLQRNTSIGLGQVVVSTARRNDLFSDLLSTGTRLGLSHNETARLLASDEYNIFAVARYLRTVADAGAGAPPGGLSATRAAFPNLDLSAYRSHSSTWPDDNIRALASEYTSAAWDDRVTTGWGYFVFEAYQDVRRSGVFGSSSP